MEGVKELKDITITWRSSAPAQFYVDTDMPSDVLFVRATLNLDTSTEWTTRTFPLDVQAGTVVRVEGKLVRFRAKMVGSTGYLQLKTPGTLRFRRIGVYINGAAGDIWQSMPMSLGV